MRHRGGCHPAELPGLPRVDSRRRAQGSGVRGGRCRGGRRCLRRDLLLAAGAAAVAGRLPAVRADLAEGRRSLPSPGLVAGDPGTGRKEPALEGGRRAGDPRPARLEAQDSPSGAVDQGEAPPARPDQCRHGALDGPVVRSLLGGVWLAFRRRSDPLALHP